MRLPRGIQTGGVPTGPVVIGGEQEVLAQAANEVSRFAEGLIEQQARAEYADAISAAEAATRDYLNRARETRVNEQTGKPSYESAEQDFSEFFSRMEQAAMENLSTKRARNAVQERLRAMRNDALPDIQQVARAQRLDEIAVRTTSAVERYVANGDYDAARLLLADQTNTFGPRAEQEIADFIDSAESGAIHQQQVDTFMAQHAEAMRAGKSAEFIRQFRTVSPFDDEETRKLVGQMQAQQRQWQAEEDELNAEFHRQEALALQGRLFDLDQRIDAGDASAYGVIEELVRRGDITASQGTAKRRTLDTKLEENREKVDGYAMLSVGLPLDEKNKAHQRIASEELIREIQNDPKLQLPQTRMAVARLVKVTNIVPQELRRAANAARLAGSVEEVLTMSDVLSRIGEVAPLQYAQFSDEQIAFYGQVSALVRANIDPTEAVTYVRETQSRDPLDRKVAEQRYREATKKKTSIEAAVDWADANFDALHQFGGTPSVPDELVSDLDTLTRAFFDVTGNIDTARELAGKKLEAQWGRTEVNGEPEMMRFAPEMIHGVWARSQFHDEMREADAEGWKLISDDITARTGGASYAVMTRNEIGHEPVYFENEDGTLEIARWRPDRRTSKEAQANVKAANQRRKELEAMRDAPLPPGAGFGTL